MKLKIKHKKVPDSKIDVSVNPARKGGVKKVKTNYKALTCLVLILAVLLAHLPILYAYESHIINVTARICHKSETRTIGFWKTHLEVAAPYFPITLGKNSGSEYYHIVDSPNNADVVFINANSKVAAIMLRAQLLAMKLNILHFGIGDYELEFEGQTITLYQLVDLADQWLTDPNSTRQDLIDIKDALAGVNEMHLLRVCLDKAMLPQVVVLEPNGGEEWEIAPEGYAVEGLGMYTIRWTAINPGGSDNDLLIYIWYCNDSGKNCFYPITGEDPTCDTENDGECWWTIPENQSFETKDPDARIKIIAIDKNNILRAGHDMSDENFCPKALSIEEIEARLGIVFEPTPLVESIIETSTESTEPSFASSFAEATEDKEATEGEEDPTEELELGLELPESIVETSTGSNEETFVPEPVIEEPVESIIETSTESNNETYESE
ncbi:hypothetical protein AMJ47_03330 [Parcubacteria bacterium DG_72]|nr:MAG: hypothetical protein AMJ47_03330 [Parcubacteria bacterium DG_72]